MVKAFGVLVKKTPRKKLQPERFTHSCTVEKVGLERKAGALTPSAIFNLLQSDNDWLYRPGEAT